ncbi:RAS GTPASE-ACTIVATING PROTEIN-BINDING PROTEIN [Salix viminalis]|uniref:RAS GTPASE-ACTIVATING PROTEIN-BINDING PROTEIN n=1 Tax=Salix viminalis TaxID=40686 RepID=A0A9Q0NR51_SALVM|nr:RAS GTPASE-ACTIVATING PROTEIN-BINDING PROTEIN [Salix viminalis]
MASAYPTVNAVQVGSYFVGQYYEVLQQHPDLLHQFYADSSNMIRIDADSTESANTMLQIHALVMSLNFTAIEIKTINSIDSWDGGVLVMVSGSVKTKDFVNSRKFVQTFFLAPQEKGYYVFNDIFLFVDDGAVYQQNLAPLPSENIYMQHPAPISSDETFNAQLDSSSPLPEPPVSDYVLEEEAREYVNSVRIDDDPVYNLPEQQQQEDFEAEIVVEETPVKETAASFQAAVNAVQDFPTAAPEEPLEEPPKKTYASILRVSKGQFSSSVSTQPPVNKSAPEKYLCNGLALNINNLVGSSSTIFLQINVFFFLVFECRRLQYSLLEGQSTLRSEDQAAALLLEVEEEGEEGGVTKQMPQGGVLVPAVWAGVAIKMVVVTTAEQEAVVSISVLYNRTDRLSGNGSVERKNHSACTWVLYLKVIQGF